MNYKIALCEDEKEICDILKEKIEKCFQDRGIWPEIRCFYHPEDLLGDRSAFDFMVYFLDIEMAPDSANGIELAHKIRQYACHEPVILFISNREELVYESLKEQPLRFIRKSHFQDEIYEAVDAIIKRLQAVSDILSIRHNGQTISLKLSDILYLESLNRIQVIVTEKETYQTYSRFSSFCEQLEPKGFLQIHRSYLVNWRAIQRINAREVILSNGISLPVSKYKTAEVKMRYHQLLSRYLAM